MRILNPEALAFAVARAYEPGRGNRARAAARVGLSDDTLAKLEAGKQQSISHETLRALGELLQGENHDLLVISIITPEMMELAIKARRHFVKQVRELTRLEGLSPSVSASEKAGRELEERWEVVKQRIARGRRPFPKRESEMWRRAAEYWLLVNRALALPGIGEELNALERASDEWRADLTFARILAPLLDYIDTCSFERAWWEFDDQEFRDFVAAGLTREKILLAHGNLTRREQDVISENIAANRPTFMEVWTMFKQEIAALEGDSSDSAQ